MRHLTALALAAALALPAATLAQQPVATAAGKTLAVEDAAALLAANPQVELSPEVVRAVAERWVDYTLLATAYSADSILATIDLDALTRDQRDQETVGRLLQAAVHPDTAFTEAQLQQAWAAEGPGEQVHARHILFQVPEGASQAQRDSIRRVAESVRQQAAAPGADFAALARRWSDDPSKDQGGDLGFFGHGQMVPSFEAAAFALQPGQVSAVVESPFGYHIIKLEERRQAALADQREDFRQFLVQRRRQEAASRWVDSLTAAVHLRVAPGAVQRAKDMAAHPATALTPAQAGETLATFDGGTYTAGELARQIAGAPADALAQFQTAPDSTIEGVVRRQATAGVLLAEARKRALAPTAQELATIREQARATLRQLLDATGLAHHRAPAGAAGSAAIQAQVRDLLRRAVTGEGQAPPLGSLGTLLRARYPVQVNEAAFPAVVDRARALRAAQPHSAPPAPPAAPPHR